MRYGPCWDMQRPHKFQGTLAEAITQYDDQSQRGAPNNIWPTDRSWLVYTDCDLWATKVSGSADLITSLLIDDDLETVQISDIAPPAAEPRSGSVTRSAAPTTNRRRCRAMINSRVPERPKDRTQAPRPLGRGPMSRRRASDPPH
jgi:hypothetical protein